MNSSKKGWILPVLVALIGGFMSILDSSIVNVALSTLMHVFQASTAEIEWIVTVYLLTLGVVIPFSGWAGDRLGIKRLYIAAMLLFTFGSFLCAISWNVNLLIAARVVQAMGGGILMPVMMAMVKKIVPEDNFGTAMGLVGISLLLAPALGPTVGGYLVEYVGWRWIFTINIPIGIAGTVLCMIFLPDFERSSSGKLDWAGAITSTVMLFSLLLALSKAADWGWASLPTLILFSISLLSFMLFLFVEFNSQNPLLNLRIFQHRNFSMANIMTVITTVGLFSGIFYVPLFLQNVKGLGAMETGLIMLPGALASGLLMPLVGKLYDRVGPRPLAVFGILSLSCTTFLLHQINLDTSSSTISNLMILRGISMAFAAVSAQTASLDSVSQHEVGGASALMNIISRLSSAFGIALLTAVMSGRIDHHARLIQLQIASSDSTISVSSPEMLQKLAFAGSLDDIFMIASILTLFGLLPALFLRKNATSSANLQSELV